MRSASSLELVIQNLLLQNPQVDLVADQLIRRYGETFMSLDELEVFAQLFLQCGFTASLVRFLVAKLEQNKGPIPWPHFVEALLLSNEQLEPEIKKALLEGALSESQLSQLSRSKKLDHYSPSLEDTRRSRRRLLWDRHLQERRELLQKHEMFRSQGLVQEEEKILEQLLVLHPHDQNMRGKKTEFRERRALDVVNNKPTSKFRSRLLNLSFEEFNEEEIEILKNIFQSQKAALDDTPRLIADFAIFHLVIESNQFAQQLCEMTDQQDCHWIKAEALLRSRKFAELLDFLSELESIEATDPDSLFAIIYLRAQALWGLEQKFSAIELLEGLLSVRPQYRSALSLFEQWKEDYA